MVVCKYFQQGYCRYGQNCRFEHVYGSKYSYHANPPPQQQNTHSTTGVTDEQLINQVQTDLHAALKGGQWILSTYAPFKEKPAFPGITDMSPEEARLLIYEAKANNTFDQTILFINEAMNAARAKYEQLLQPSAPIIKALRSLYKGETVISPFSNTQPGFGSSNPAALFQSAVQNAPAFGQSNPTVFAQSHNTSDNSPAQSIFAQANQNIFGSPSSNNVFGVQNQDAATSIFAQAVQTQSNPTNIFASASHQFFGSQQQQQNSAFQTQTPTNVSQNKTIDVFKLPASNVFEQPRTDDSQAYSKMEELSSEQLEAFNSNGFKLGFIPEVPPPHSLCV